MRHRRPVLTRRDLYWLENMAYSNSTVLALMRALTIKCPTCWRDEGDACVLPPELSHQGLYVHHSRIAAGNKK